MRGSFSQHNECEGETARLQAQNRGDQRIRTVAQRRIIQPPKAEPSRPCSGGLHERRLFTPVFLAWKRKLADFSDHEDLLSAS
jgi:hypothetical protein